MPPGIGLGVGSNVLGLYPHDLFKMRMSPITISRILADASPDRIDQIELSGQGLAAHSVKDAVTCHAGDQGIFNDVPVKEFLHRAPAFVLRIVGLNQTLPKQ